MSKSGSCADIVSSIGQRFSKILSRILSMKSAARSSKIHLRLERSIMISLLNNLRMAFKIGLIALMMGGVTIGLVSYMGSRMSSIDLGYADLIARIDTNTTLVARAGRRGETYRAAAYALLTETTE